MRMTTYVRCIVEHNNVINNFWINKNKLNSSTIIVNNIPWKIKAKSCPKTLVEVFEEDDCPKIIKG